MITVQDFYDALLAQGIRIISGVPCALLQPLIDYASGHPDIRYVGAANEADAVAIAAGADLGGQHGAIMLQNSGLGNAVSPLTSLNHTFRIPTLMVISLRGESGGSADEPQHALMGAITTEFLELLGIPWSYLPAHADELEAVMERAFAHMREARLPFALILRQGIIEDWQPPASPVTLTGRAAQVGTSIQQPAGTRRAVLRTIQTASRADDLIVAATGHTGKELFALGDTANQLYMVGSMGCAPSLALGLAIAQPERRIIVVDGDGGLLMHLGALSTLGRERPGNLIHILLDNGIHESTGGQAAGAGAIDFPAIATACGYPQAVALGSLGQLTDLLATEELDGPTFAHVRILPGTADQLPSPSVEPSEVAQRLRRLLGTIQ